MEAVQLKARMPLTTERLINRQAHNTYLGSAYLSYSHHLHVSIHSTFHKDIHAKTNKTHKYTKKHIYKHIDAYHIDKEEHNILEVYSIDKKKFMGLPQTRKGPSRSAC